MKKQYAISALLTFLVCPPVIASNGYSDKLTPNSTYYCDTKSMDKSVHVLSSVNQSSAQSDGFTVSNLTKPLIRQDDLNSGKQFALFPDVIVNKKDQDFNGQHLILSGLPASANFRFGKQGNSKLKFDATSGIFTYQSEPVASLSNENNGKEGKLLDITFTSQATNEVVVAVLQSIYYENESSLLGDIALTVTLGGKAVFNSAQYKKVMGSENPASAIPGGLAPGAFVDIDDDGDLDLFKDYDFYINSGTPASPAFELVDAEDNPLSKAYGAGIAFTDVDHDGDLDAFAGDYDGFIFYYKNTGSKSSPEFSRYVNEYNPFYCNYLYLVWNGEIESYDARPAFVDINNDGKNEAFIADAFGISYFMAGESSWVEGVPVFLGSPFFHDNPFYGYEESYNTSLAFTDIDSDGDFDAFIGQYDGILFFENKGTKFEPEMSQITGAANPLSHVDLLYSYNTHIALADIDADGDQDAFIGEEFGETYFYQNDSVFVLSIIEDVDPPVIVAPEPPLLKANSWDDTYLYSRRVIQAFIKSVTAKDEVDGDVVVTYMAPTEFVMGDNVIRFSATDGAGNTAELEVVVTLSTDIDEDGYVNWEDDFPNNPAIAVDTDGDGMADDYVEGCYYSCQRKKKVTIDTDDDNDGIPDDQDDLPLDPSNAILRPSAAGDLILPQGASASTPVWFKYDESNNLYSVTPVTTKHVINFKAEFRKVWLYQLPDMNGNGAHEYGLFGIRSDAGFEERVQLFIRDSETGEKVSVLNWVNNWHQVSLVVMKDMTGDGIIDFGLQGLLTRGYRPQLVVKNGMTNQSFQTFSLPDLWHNPVYLNFNDVTGDGISEVALFGQIKRNNRFQVKIIDGSDKNIRLKAYNFPAYWTETSWHNIGDYSGDGVDDWALLGHSKGDGRWQLIIKNGLTPSMEEAIYAWPDLKAAKLMRLTDLNEDGVREFALGGLNQKGRWQLQIKDGQDRHNTMKNISWPNNLQQAGLHVIGDVDGDDKDELALMGMDSEGGIALFIKTSKDDYGSETTLELGSDWAEMPAISQFDTDGDGIPEWVAWGKSQTGTAKMQVLQL